MGGSEEGVRGYPLEEKGGERDGGGGRGGKRKEERGKREEEVNERFGKQRRKRNKEGKWGGQYEEKTEVEGGARREKWGLFGEQGQ